MSKIILFKNDHAAIHNHFVKAWITTFQHSIEQLPQSSSEVTHQRFLIAGCGAGIEIPTGPRATEDQLIIAQKKIIRGNEQL